MLEESDNNIYLRIESLVADSENEIEDLVEDVYDQIDGDARTAGRDEPIGNWVGGFWAWAGSSLNWFREIIAWAF